MTARLTGSNYYCASYYVPACNDTQSDLTPSRHGRRVEIAQQRQIGGQQRQIGGQHGPGDGRVRHGKRMSGRGHELVGGGSADLQAPGCAEADEPATAQCGQPGGIGELGSDQPADLGSEHVGQANVRPGKLRSSWPSNWFFVAVRSSTRPVRCADQAVSWVSTESPSRTGSPRPASNSSGHRLQVDRVGLDRPLAEHATLLGDVARVEREQLPPRRPPADGQQRPMIVPGSLDPDLDPRSAGSSRWIVSTTSRTEGPVIGQPGRGFSSFIRAASVTDTANSFLPTSIATTTVAPVAGAA